MAAPQSPSAAVDNSNDDQDEDMQQSQSSQVQDTMAETTSMNPVVDVSLDTVMNQTTLSTSSFSVTPAGGGGGVASTAAVSVASNNTRQQTPLLNQA